MKLNRFFCALMLPLLCPAAEIPELIIPQGVGVNIHFVSGHEPDLDMIAAGGFKLVRMDFAWDEIESKKGEYDWSGYDQLMRNLDQRGIRAVFILDYSNPLYEEAVTSKNPLTGKEHKTTAAPQHPESVAAFARWAAASVKHFSGRHIIWEIWNEPNIHFWSPEPDAQQYATLALATAKAVRESDPGATLIAPASSGFPWDFLETLFKAGALEYLDAVSVHPYRNYLKGPETAAADYAKLRELMDRYAPGARKGKIPILSGEWGYATHQGGLSLETQGAFAVRQQLSNLLNNVPLSIWYDWKNDGPDPNEREHNFGTVTANLDPKPAYTYLKTLTHQLAGYRLARRIKVERDTDYVLLFTKGLTQKVAAWTTAEPHNVKFEMNIRKTMRVSAVRANGQPFDLGAEQSGLRLYLGGAPVYVTVGPALLGQ